MGLQVKAGETRSYDVKGKTVSGFRLAAILEANAVNVPITPVDFKPQLVYCKISLKRKNTTYVLYNDFVAPAALVNVYGDECGMELINPLNGSNLYELVASGAAAKEKMLLSYDVDLKYPINLRGDDTLQCEVSFPTSAQTGTNLINSATSYIDIQEIDALGLESFTPYLKTYMLQSGQTTANIVLGDNVTEIYVLNIDKNSVLEADAPFTTVSLMSDKFNWSKPFTQVAAERQQNVVSFAALVAHRQSYLIYNGEELDNVTLALTLNAANVTTGNNWVVWRTFFVDERLSRLAEITAAQHFHENRAKKGLSTGGVNAAALARAKSAYK